jgi:hypothetical protein
MPIHSKCTGPILCATQVGLRVNCYASHYAYTSKNFKGTYIRRLRLAFRKVQAVCVELQQRTVATHGVVGLEEGNAYLRDRVHFLENEVSCFQETVRRLTSELERAEALARRGSLQKERTSPVGTKRGTDEMIPVAPMGYHRPPYLAAYTLPGRVKPSPFLRLGEGGGGCRD